LFNAASAAHIRNDLTCSLDDLVVTCSDEGGWTWSWSLCNMIVCRDHQLVGELS